MNLDTLLFSFWRWLTLGIEIHLGPFLCFLLGVALMWYATGRTVASGIPREGAR